MRFGVAFLVLAAAGLVAACGPAVTVTEGVTPVEQHVLSTGEDALIHVIGIHEAASNTNPTIESPARITVASADGGPLKLALSAYNPTSWTIDGPGAHRIAAIYIDGAYNHRVSGAEQATRLDYSGRLAPGRRNREEAATPGGAALGRVLSARNYVPEIPHNPGTRFVRNAEAVLGSKARSFTGSYQASAFRIDD